MSPARALMVPALAMACLLAAADAFPQGYEPEPVYGYQPEQPYGRDKFVVAEIQPRQGYGKPSYGRVKIQTYRGPSKGHGYDVFAPWGYYVTQPEDDKGYGYH
ncbi:uncharacterized protein LOC119103744 [Pollicipes pollicipes]|uniref:uncharacterized protein LOC119103744 n=1 Tax=Pollicipes pollicipes TaxID=41117 RepID=UPI001884A62F|nr:uncharacterized protein LOC119103744 [Pollicipes pollicipes]